MRVVHIARGLARACSLLCLSPPWRKGRRDCGYSGLARGSLSRYLPVAVAVIVLATALVPSAAVARDDGTYSDVPADTYYTVPVQTLGADGVFDGTLCDDGFCPNDPIDRKTMAVWTVRVVEGQDPPAISRTRFDDVNMAGFHGRFIERLAELGITKGCDDGSSFCPDRTVTRAEMAAFLSRAFNLPDGPDPNFSDVPHNTWYATYVGRLAASGITLGCGDGTFCPLAATTRGQMATFLHRAKNRTEHSVHTHGFPIPEKKELQSPQLGTSLDDLVSRLEAGEITEEAAAREAPVSRGKSVAVTIHLSGSVDGVVQFLADNANIAPRHIGEDYVEAFLPVRLLRQLPEVSGVLYIEAVVPPEPPQTPSQETIPGNGPGVHGSAVWNEAGFTGEGIKVGVIDSGFEGFSDLMGTEVPATVIARCYGVETDESQGLASCEGNSSHGTKVAESIIDMAPDVSLYIATPKSRGDLSDIVDWMNGKGVSVINMSLSWAFDGPGDGTSPSSTSPLNAVNTAVENGVVWVNSAGNYANRAWFGGPTDYDSDNTLEFEGTEQLTVSGGRWVELRWDDRWGGASLDLDLYLFDSDGMVIEESVNPQTGQRWHNPYERLRLAESGVTLQVVNRSARLPRWIQIIQRGGTIGDATGTGSIINPAESTNPGMLAVGAARWNSPETIESFSSRGPTPNGETKPDLVGADCGTTKTSPFFCGTSQASPHVAGMAALVRQRYPDLTPQRVVAYLKENAIDRSLRGADSTWGHGFAVLPPVTPDTAALQRAALTALYNATDGANWDDNTNWLSDRPLNEWHGVWTDSDGRVIRLDLQGNGLSGVIPSQLGDLASLRALWLSGNGLSGAIPSGLGRLSNLQSLGLYDTRLGGSIPPELGGLSNLGRLYLVDNQLSGAIPSGLGRLSNLELLELEHNRLSGAIPSELGRLSNLTQLRLNGNQLSGAIPSQLGSLTNLELLDLRDNQLGGTIPFRLGSLTNLEYLLFNDNRLTGMLPLSLTRLAGLEEFGFGGNSGLCASADAVFQDWLESIPNNWLGIPHGPKCADTAALQRAALVALYNATGGPDWWRMDNWLTDRPLTEWLGVTTDSNGRVIRLALVHKGLSGEIPPELGDLTNLWLLSLASNGDGLSGVIPPELGNLINLGWLDLSQNQLSGEIPPELGSLTNLEHLSIVENQLSGVIPSELGSLTNLASLGLSENQLSGVIPSELGGLTNLASLGLSENQLSGGIPPELGGLTNLQYLNLSHNQLSGVIPSELGGLTNLGLLDLRDNPNLSGALPGSFTGLTSLSRLYVIGTGLCAPTDSAFQSWLAGLDERVGVVNCTESPVEPLGGPPPSLGLDPFYAKYLDAGGLPIVSSSAVPDEALYRAKDIIGEMLSDRADLIATMAERDVRVVVQGESMHHTELPEVGGTVGSDNLRGFFLDPLVVTSEENLLCYDTDPHRYGEVLIHELAHAVHFVGIEKRQDRTFSRRVEQAFQDARAAGLWDYTYAATNSVEYWAEGVEIWFGINDPPGLSGNDVNTRRELEEYDPALARLVAEVFGDATVSSSCQEIYPSDRRTTLVQGGLTGTDGQPVNDVWIGARSVEQVDSRWGITGWAGLMGTFWIRVHDGMYTLAVYAAPEGTCAGWYDGDGGITTDYDQAARLTAEGVAIEDLSIRLPVSPENLPSVQC